MAAAKIQVLKDLSLVLYGSDPTWGTVPPRGIWQLSHLGDGMKPGIQLNILQNMDSTRQQLVNGAEVEKLCFTDKNLGRNGNNRGSQNSSWVVDKNTDTHMPVRSSKLWLVLESRICILMRIPNDSYPGSTSER